MSDVCVGDICDFFDLTHFKKKISPRARTKIETESERTFQNIIILTLTSWYTYILEYEWAYVCACIECSNPHNFYSFFSSISHETTQAQSS